MLPASPEAALKSALSGLLAPSGPHPDTLPGPPGGERYTPAAVLVPLVAGEGALELVLTVRTAHLKSHPGQISFPGGHVEPGDGDVDHTARREAEEELGIAAAAVQTLGCLPACVTGTGYRIVPVVGVLDAGTRYRPDDFEVADVFHAPLGYVLAPGNRREETRELRGRLVSYPVIEFEGRRIWGATARVIVSLAACLEQAGRLGGLARFL